MASWLTRVEAPYEGDGPYKFAEVCIHGEGGWSESYMIPPRKGFSYGRRPELHAFVPDMRRRQGFLFFNGHFVEYRHCSSNVGYVHPRKGESVVPVIGVTRRTRFTDAKMSDLPVCHIPLEPGAIAVSTTRVTELYGPAYLLTPGTQVTPLHSAPMCYVEIVAFWK